MTTTPLLLRTEAENLLLSEICAKNERRYLVAAMGPLAIGDRARDWSQR
jgi:hypothetical protein